MTIPEGQVGHIWPQLLPDGKNLLYTLSTGEDSELSVLSMDTGESRVLVSETSGAFQARYVSTGHLVYAHSGGLWAVPFDVSTLELASPPVSVLDDVYEIPLIIPEPANYFSVADNGSMIYVPGPMAGANSLVWVDREGQETTWVDEGKMYNNPRLSPDGRSVVLAVTTPDGGDIWIYEVDRGTRTRLTFGGLHNEPVWSPDGARIAFATATWGAVDWMPTDGSSPAQTLVQNDDVFQVPSSWSPDGRTLTFYKIGSDTTRDIWALPMDGDAVPKLILGTEFNEHSAMFSPDGRWLVYISDESGREEVYVRPYPGPEAKQIVSTEGGREPVWSADGGEIFYRSGDKVLAVDVQTDPDFTAGTPRVLFEEPYAMWYGGGNNYDVTPDGRRFLMIKTDLESAPRQIHVVLNWFEELKRLVPIQ
jgi:serine/threonine-protein kinase